MSLPNLTLGELLASTEEKLFLMSQLAQAASEMETAETQPFPDAIAELAHHQRLRLMACSKALPAAILAVTIGGAR